MDQSTVYTYYYIDTCEINGNMLGRRQQQPQCITAHTPKPTLTQYSNTNVTTPPSCFNVPMGFRNYRQHDMGDFKRWGINIDWVHLRHWNSFPAANHHQQKHEPEKAAQMSSSQANLEPVLSSGPTHIKIKACPLALASLNKPHILRCYTCC